MCIIGLNLANSVLSRNANSDHLEPMIIISSNNSYTEIKPVKDNAVTHKKLKLFKSKIPVRLGLFL
jgi:hypothetical protein